MQRIHGSRHEGITVRIAFFAKQIGKLGDLSPSSPNIFV